MIAAVVQARVSSSRFPEKVLKPILGRPMIYRQLERVQRCRSLKKVIIATSSDGSDNALEELFADSPISVFRGSLNDVLDRFYQASKHGEAKHVVRLTGDCPLIDPDLIDLVIAYHLNNDLDYATNDLPPSYPDGLDVEVMRFEALESAWREATLPSQREHVTPFIYQQPQRFKIGSYQNKQNLSHLRWTVDEPKDFELVNIIYENLYPSNPLFTTQDVLKFLDQHPELMNYNTAHRRNEGYEKSLREDTQFKQGSST